MKEPINWQWRSFIMSKLFILSIFLFVENFLSFLRFPCDKISTTLYIGKQPSWFEIQTWHPCDLRFVIDVVDVILPKAPFPGVIFHLRLLTIIIGKVELASYEKRCVMALKLVAESECFLLVFGRSVLEAGIVLPPTSHDWRIVPQKSDTVIIVLFIISY